MKQCAKCGKTEAVTSFYVTARWCKPCMKAYRLCKKYSLSQEQLDTMYINQDHKCVICEDFLANKAVIDRDHQTGKVRGLLCSSCNSLLGFAKDNTTILAKAIVYLAETSIKKKG